MEFLYQKIRLLISRIQLIDKLVTIFKFYNHNRRLFVSGGHASRVAAPIILMELNAMHSAHIAYAYLADELAREHGAQIKAYAPVAFNNWRHRMIFQLKKFIGWGEFGAYKSFGVNEFIEIRLSSMQCRRASELYADVLNRIHCTRDVEDLHINGVWIGDLIYDTFLMKFKKPTIDPKSSIFKGFLLQSIQLFVFWDAYLTNNDVRGLNVSHCVYNLAIPLRLAVERGICVFQANITHLYKLDKHNIFAYNDFYHFRKRFASLPANVREVGIALAERRIQRRFAGEIGVDMAYSTKSAYGAARHERLLRESLKKKILVATHCFFDSPHSYGKNIFPDFYEWLEFLGAMSEVTNYDWYIKTHPDYLPGTKEIIDCFVDRYPKFTLLPSDASHMQIISEGIDFALTTYGTIAFEYAALGVPVINASLNNPHIAYDFNLHARDVDHYRGLLENIEKLEFSIDQRQVYEYYFMRNIYNTENLFFEDYDCAIADIGGYDEQFTPAIYKKWLAKWSSSRHADIVKALHKFAQSKEFRMDYSFYGKEFSASSLEH